jgi:hypothetical protein
MDPSSEYKKHSVDKATDMTEHETKKLRKRKKGRHERRRLKERAGTVVREGKASREVGDWKEGTDKPYRKEYFGTNVEHGKDPETGRPIKSTLGGLRKKPKSHGEESEY